MRIVVPLLNGIAYVPKSSKNCAQENESTKCCNDNHDNLHFLCRRCLELFGFGPGVNFKLLAQNWRLIVEIAPPARTGQSSLLKPLAPPLHDHRGPLLEPEIDPVHELPDQEDSAAMVGQEAIANGRVRNTPGIETRP